MIHQGVDRVVDADSELVYFIWKPPRGSGDWAISRPGVDSLGERVDTHGFSPVPSNSPLGFSDGDPAQVA